MTVEGEQLFDPQDKGNLNRPLGLATWDGENHAFYRNGSFDN